MNNFHKWAKEFDSQNLYAFNHNPNGLLWLKVRAICRGKLLKQFVTSNNIELTSTKIAEQNIELFEELEKTPNAMQVLDIFLNDREHEWYQSAGIDENKLKSDLYKVHHYAWGGNVSSYGSKKHTQKYRASTYHSLQSVGLCQCFDSTKVQEPGMKSHCTSSGKWNYKS